MIGYIYVLINPSLQGMVKIGKTTRDPEERAKELSSATGVPTPFIVAYSVMVSDCDAAEKFTHELLTLQGARLTKNREFFEISLPDAIKILTECEKIYCELESDNINQYEEEADPVDKYFEYQYGSSYRLYSHILKEARNYRRGEEGFFEDHIEAEKLYKKAIRLGSIAATHELALLYFSSTELYNLKKSLELAKQTLEMVTDFRSKGTGLASLYDIEVSVLDLLAKIYFFENKLDNSQKAILMIFEKYKDAISAILVVLANVKLAKVSDGSNSVIADELRSHIEKKFSDLKEHEDFFDITSDFELKCDEIQSFLFYYFQDVARNTVPLVNIDLLNNNGISHVEKIKMNYFFDYSLFREHISLFDDGIRKYRNNFCRPFIPSEERVLEYNNTTPQEVKASQSIQSDIEKPNNNLGIIVVGVICFLIFIILAT